MNKHIFEFFDLQAETMTTLLKRVKAANKYFKYTVFGYLREYEEKESNLNTPMMVKCICLNYYLIKETFEKHGDFVSLNGDKNTAIKYCDDTKPMAALDTNTVYGDLKMDNFDESISEYQWKFKIMKFSFWFEIGIDSSNESYTNSDFTSGGNEDTFHSCVFNQDAATIFETRATGWHLNEKFERKSSKIDLKEDDEIDMVFNIQTKTLKFKVKGEFIEPCSTEIDLNDKQYSMAIAMNETATIQFVDFCIKHK